MTPDEMQREATQLMLKRFHCSQAVAAVGIKKLGLNSYEIIKAMGAFGGGLGGNGEVCGAVVGGLAVIGLMFSRGKEEELEDRRMWLYTREFLRRFSQEIGEGHILCRDIIRVDWTNREEVKAFYRGKSQKCIDLVGKTARMLGVMMDEMT
ncbi:MAG TPA: C-GCAxxG-C-C family protein [Syntrophales bacterium]|nr:C-GCAxxG-C-C family protein [Syntrophales bacterium]HOL59000.1 C-GCAxxG-C-C family protein [Syntrophales bacterium]HPO34722.1 C-GCAxxG-C-C family protein [Syntrophales bacterium]